MCLNVYSLCKVALNINHLLPLMPGGGGGSFVLRPRRKLYVDGDGETEHQVPGWSVPEGLSGVI